jgi:hypothetical protein
MDRPFEVFPYNIDRLTHILSEKSGASIERVSDKIHTIYFQEYFQNIKARTILIENDYIDRDYLEDFSAYYVRCFADYKRKCTRLHFFQNEFDHEDFDSLLGGTSKRLKSELQSDYLGFIVVKPLPLTIIGRTCLKTYPTDGENNRNFPIIRNYETNLFGLPLSIKSLAFQEQDNVVAACATSALWSVFHGTCILFQHNILSPVEITRAATKQLPIETRTFPNKGLSSEQMAHAIQSVNLEPLFVEIKNEEFALKSYIYAYLRFGIPILMGIDLYDVSSTKPKHIGHHAVAVTGYRMDAQPAKRYEENSLGLVSSNISKLYAHDDQVGPFARMVFDDLKVTLTEGKKELISMSTSWKFSGTEMGDIRAVPLILMIPLYHKIRIPFETIYETVGSFDAIVETLKENVPTFPKVTLDWDIFLTTVNTFKKEIFSSGEYAGDHFKSILLKQMPRFMWRATALIDGKLTIDLLFDATDIEQGDFFIGAVEFDPNFCWILREIFKESFFEKTLKSNPIWTIIEWFRENNKVIH